MKERFIKLQVPLLIAQAAKSINMRPIFLVAVLIVMNPRMDMVVKDAAFSMMGMILKILLVIVVILNVKS